MVLLLLPFSPVSRHSIARTQHTRVDGSGVVTSKKFDRYQADVLWPQCVLTLTKFRKPRVLFVSWASTASFILMFIER